MRIILTIFIISNFLVLKGLSIYIRSGEGMKVNGKDLILQNLSSHSIFSILEFYKLKPETLAIEKNGEIIPKENWKDNDLLESDQIEIIKFVGGG
jgi:sulfur carrier protein